MSKKDDDKGSKPGGTPIEAHAEKHSTPAWLFAATKMQRKWAAGALVSEADYLAAVELCAHGKV